MGANDLEMYATGFVTPSAVSVSALLPGRNLRHQLRQLSLELGQTMQERVLWSEPSWLRQTPHVVLRPQPCLVLSEQFSEWFGLFRKVR